jgi:hypothetical protein
LQATSAEIDTQALHQSFPSSHLGEGCRLLTGEGRFETCGGSHFQLLPAQGRHCGASTIENAATPIHIKFIFP